MVVIKCPRTGCTFSTSDADAVVAAAILNGHTAEHTSTNTNATGAGGAKPPPVEQPKLQASSSKADWLVSGVQIYMEHV